MMVRVADRAIAVDTPVYIVAEIGINHNGDLDLARRTIEAAKAAGADAVKFQNYRTEDFVTDRTLTHTYASPDGPRIEQLYDMFKRAEMSESMLADIAGYCGETGIDWHSTPTSEAGIDLLVRLGAPVLKNGSDYLGHLPLIAAMGRTGLPVVLSTGMASLGDIEDAVEALRATGNDQLILLHCTSQYPTPAAEANVRRVATLAQTYDCDVGFSDHTKGNASAIAAVTLGACWIEKHFTLDKALPGPDHNMSCDPAEFASLVADIRFIETALGTPAIRLSENEQAARSAHRLSCAAARDLKAGERLQLADISFLRPGSGIPPRNAGLLAGRSLARDLSAGHILMPEDFA